MTALIFPLESPLKDAWPQIYGRATRAVPTKAESVEVAESNEARLDEARKILARYVEFLPKYFGLKAKDRGLPAGAAMGAVAIALEDMSDMAQAVSNMESSLKYNDLPMFGFNLEKFKAAHDSLRAIEADFVF